MRVATLPTHEVGYYIRFPANLSIHSVTFTVAIACCEECPSSRHAHSDLQTPDIKRLINVIYLCITINTIINAVCTLTFQINLGLEFQFQFQSHSLDVLRNLKAINGSDITSDITYMPLTLSVNESLMFDANG